MDEHSAPLLYDVPIGTAHPLAMCYWCQSPLVVAEITEKRHWVCRYCVARQMAWALVRLDRKTRAQRVEFVPLPTQVPLYELGIDGGAILWGGMKGGAKSVGVRWWLYHRSLSIEGHEALLLRENWDQLLDNHTSKMRYEVEEILGGKWYADPPRAVFGGGSKESTVTCGHMATADAVLRYAGGNKGAIACDEGSLYPLSGDGSTVLSELRTMARTSHVDRSGRTIKPVFVVATNPGGPSASWLKDMFIDHQPDYERYPRLRGTYNPARWHYLPATLETNPYLDAQEYRDQNLSGLSETRYRQLAEGDWHATHGQFFPEWSEACHVLAASVAQEA